jgi:hypothetical protein
MQLEARVKSMILATVLTLVMCSPGLAVDVRDLPGSLLVASKPDKGQPPVLIIKGEGGKVTGVEKGGKDRKRKERK